MNIERFTLEDGRLAERHTTVNEVGEKVVEIFVEDKRPLKLEKRITEKRKEVLAEQKIEVIKDGEIVDLQIHALEPNVRLQLQEHIGLAENAELNPSNYVSKRELTETIVSAMRMAEKAEYVSRKDVTEAVVSAMKMTQPTLKVQSIVESTTEEKKKTDTIVMIVMAVIIAAQLAFFGYIMLWM